MDDQQQSYLAGGKESEAFGSEGQARPTLRASDEHATTPEAARYEFSLDSEHDGDGAYLVANFTPDANGEWVRWDAYVAHLDNERERCARLVEVYARVLDESIKGGIGDSARTLAKYIRDGALP